MKYFLFVLVLIAFCVAAFFYIKHSVALLLGAIAVIIAGYFLTVRTIAYEEE